MSTVASAIEAGVSLERGAVARRNAHGPWQELRMSLQELREGKRPERSTSLCKQERPCAPCVRCHTALPLPNSLQDSVAHSAGSLRFLPRFPTAGRAACMNQHSV